MTSNALRQAFMDRVWFSPTTSVPEVKLKNVKGRFEYPSRLVKVVHHDPTSVIIVGLPGYCQPGDGPPLLLDLKYDAHHVPIDSFLAYFRTDHRLSDLKLNEIRRCRASKDYYIVSGFHVSDQVYIRLSQVGLLTDVLFANELLRDSPPPVVYGYALPPPCFGLMHAGSDMVLPIDMYSSTTTKSTPVAALTVMRRAFNARELGKDCGWVSPLQPLDWASVLAEEEV